MAQRTTRCSGDSIPDLAFGHETSWFCSNFDLPVIGGGVLGTEPAASLEARLKTVAQTFRDSYKTKPDKTITKLLTSVAALGQIIQ
ncbi:hypothetical protein OAF50_01920 [bacterium]|nr:hypothetical protein [bacterium]